jgi:hypothetical protein
MFTRPEGFDWMVNLRATMLDEHGWFVPFAEFWTSEKLSWATIPARHSHGKVPDLAGFEPLVKAMPRRARGPRQCSSAHFRSS